MPPKRKALETSDANVAAGRTSAKKAKPDAPDQTAPQGNGSTDAILKAITKQRENRWSKVSGSKNLDADYWLKNRNTAQGYEFVCQCDPFRGGADDDDWDDADSDDDGSTSDKGDNSDAPVCDSGKTCPCTKTAASLPSHPYSLTRAGLARYHTAGDMANLRNPDNLGMYTYNDHAAYGVIEVVQNMLLDFDDAFKASEAHEAWAIVEGMALFMLLGNGQEMCMADDGDTVTATTGQICRMVLAALSLLDDKGKFKDGATVFNLSWILGLYLRMAEADRSNGVLGEAEHSTAKTFKFYTGNIDRYLQAYAKRFGVRAQGASEDEDDDKVTMPKLDVQDPWGWDKSFATYKKDHATPDFGLGGDKFPTIGGDKLDISTWSSAERKKHSFNNRDPFPKDIVKKLKEGLCLALA